MIRRQPQHHRFETLLRGVRLVTLAVNAPGPVAASRLSSLGATVVKVEPPDGDPLQKYCPRWYQDLIGSQKIRRLNLKESEDRAMLDHLLAKTDLLLTANRPAVLQNLSLGWKDLHAKFPELCHVALVGHAAPHQNMPGHDLTYLARLGLVVPPTLPVTLWADLASAERLLSTSLNVLLARQKSRTGIYREVIIEEMAREFAAPLRYGLTAAGGLLGGGLAYYNLYCASDGWVAVAALEPHFSRKLQKELQLKTCGYKQLQSVLRTRTACEWERWAAKHGLPLVVVRRF